MSKSHVVRHMTYEGEGVRGVVWLRPRRLRKCEQLEMHVERRTSQMLRTSMWGSGGL